MSLEDNISVKSRNSSSDSLSCDYEIIQSQNTSALESIEDLSKVKSVFYCDFVGEKSESKDSIDQNFKVEENYTIFNQVTYLGFSDINHNHVKSEETILNIIKEKDTAKDVTEGIKISISIPNSPDGLVILYDDSNSSILSNFDIHCILFYAKDSSLACFGFSWAQQIPDVQNQEQAVYQCHVFRCNIKEAVNQISKCFSKAFQRTPQSLTNSIAENSLIGSISSEISGSAIYEFFVNLDIKEKISKNYFTNAVRERSSGFKLRANSDREIFISVKQSKSVLQKLKIERCFGVLLNTGKLKKQADFKLLDFFIPDVKDDKDAFFIRAEWKANDKEFEKINLSDPIFLSIAVDLVIKGIVEPLRFVIETRVTVSETKFMDNFLFHYNKRPMTVKFFIQLKENEEKLWIVDSIDNDEIFDQQTSSFNQKLKNFSKMVRSTSTVDSFEYDDLSPQDKDSIEDDGSQMEMASGTGYEDVMKDCTQEKLDAWAIVINEWQNSGKRPKNLTHLVRVGIPEALRCKIWQKLTNTETRTDMIENYRILLTKDASKCENIILRDISRTFPAHKFFQECGGSGQDSLFKVSKAYANYDDAVGYCQGISFIIAAILLHTPEEEAFSIFASIMFDYGLRDTYLRDFENLSLRLFQLTCLLRDNMNDLYEHFTIHNVECFQFASSWILTVFTARFSLPFVFHVLDLFLLDGFNVIFQIAMALLNSCKRELLERKDFEQIIKYIRISLPKRFLTEAQVLKLMKQACDWKISKLRKYEDEFKIQKKENEKTEKLMKQLEFKFCDEKKSLQNEVIKLNRKIKVFEESQKKHETIILDYKKIIQRQEELIENKQEKELNSKENSVESSKFYTLGPLDPLANALQRIQELELELAKCKLEKCEAECLNDELNHQLTVKSNTTTKQGLLQKLHSTIQEKVKRDSITASFQSYTTDEDKVNQIASNT